MYTFQLEARMNTIRIEEKFDKRRQSYYGAHHIERRDFLQISVHILEFVHPHTVVIQLRVRLGKGEKSKLVKTHMEHRHMSELCVWTMGVQFC